MAPSLILDTVTRAAFPVVLAFSLYLLFVGHNAPGGGFVGGLTAGIALVLLYAGGGLDRLSAVVTVGYVPLLGGGLLLAGCTGMASLLAGEPFLTSAIVEFTVPLYGTVKLVTVLLFDIGVYLIVLGLVLALLTVLGGARDQVARAGARADGAGVADPVPSGYRAPAGRAGPSAAGAADRGGSV